MTLKCIFSKRMPAFRSNLEKQIEEEKSRNDRLQQEVNAMEKSVKSLQEKGAAALKAKLSELGITATTSDGVLAVSRSLIAQNKILVQKEKMLQVCLSSYFTCVLLIQLCNRNRWLRRSIFITKCAKSMNNEKFGTKGSTGE